MLVLSSGVMLLSSPVISGQPFISECVSNLVKEMSGSTELVVRPLLDCMCIHLWPDHDHTKCLQVDRAWKLLPPRMLLSLTVLCCQLLVQEQSTTQQSAMSRLIGYSLVYGSAAGAEFDDLVSQLLAFARESPFLLATHVHLWALLYYGEYLMSKGRFTDAMQPLQGVRDGTQEEQAVTEMMRDRACFLLCKCLLTTHPNLLAVPDVTLVADFLALGMKTGEVQYVFSKLQSTSHGGDGHDLDDSRAEEMMEYFQRIPRLRFGPVHLWFLHWYGLHLFRKGERDTAEALWREVLSSLSEPSEYTKPHELVEVQVRSLICIGELPHLEISGAGTEYFEQCIPLLQNTANNCNIEYGTHLYLLSQVYLGLEMPEEALECLAQLLLVISRDDGIRTVCVYDIFLKMAVAAQLLKDNSFALELAQQARLAYEAEFSEDEMAQFDVGKINNMVCALLYSTGQLESLKEYSSKAYEQVRQGKDQHVYESSYLIHKVRADYATVSQDCSPGQGGFRMPPHEASETLHRSLVAMEAALPLDGRYLLRLNEPVDLLEQRYDSIKKQNQVDLIVRDGITLTNSVSCTQERKLMVLRELYELLVRESKNFQEIDVYTKDMAIIVGKRCAEHGLWEEPYHLFTAVLKQYIMGTQTSLAQYAAEETSVQVDCSNYYKSVFLLLLRHCLAHDQTWRAFIWAERCKSRALSARLGRPFINIVSGFKQIPKHKRSFIECQPDFDNDDECVAHSVMNCLGACKAMLMQYTLVSPEVILIHTAMILYSSSDERDAFFIKEKLVDLDEVLDDDTKQQAENEYNSLSDKLFEDYPYTTGATSSQVQDDQFMSLSNKISPYGTFISSDTASTSTSAVQQNVNVRRKGVAPRLLAENSVRGQITSVWIQGLVALTQRLAAEAENAINDKRTAERIAIQMKTLFGILYDVLIKPVGDELDKASAHIDVLLIVPDEDLGVLPFSAFYNEDTDKYLVEDFAVVMAPSLRVAGFCKEVYEQMSRDAPRAELVVGRTEGYPEGWGGLNNAEKEMQAVKSCFSSAGQYLHFKPDEQHAKSSVLSQIKDASWIHFTVHGEVSKEFPRGSLLLGNSDEERLTADEISKCGPLSARGVVLSACETGLGAIRGEGILGLVRAFFLAGAPLVIASAWKISDSFTASYMEKLYKKLREGKVCVAIAMQEVVLESMEEINAKNSCLEINLFKWAAFTCVGYPRVMFPFINPS